MRNDQFGRAVQVGRYKDAPTTLGLSVATARVQLQPGRHYRLWSSVDCFFRFGGGAVVATLNDHPIKGGIDTLHTTDTTDVWIAAIVSSGSGTLFISELAV